MFAIAQVLAGGGELDEHDRGENEIALEHGFRLLSAYTLADGTRIWVITEAEEANHAKVKKLQKELHRLYARIAEVLESYTDEPDGPTR